MIANRVIGGNGGETASIFVTGLSETDTVTATKDGKTYSGKWVSKEFYPTMSYRYIKWLITEQKSANSSGCQASELGFCDKDGNRFNFPAGTISTQSCAETANETAEKLIDNNTSTKFNYGGNNSKYPNVSVQFDLGSGNEINLDDYSKYYWYTANDAEGRDPISWTLYGSNDGNTWDVIDEQTNQTITSNRLSKAGEWSIDTSVKTDYGWFIEGLRNYGTYTITATDGTNTTTQDILVDMATQYDVEMTLSGTLYLYNLGDECEDVTGGWEFGNIYGSGGLAQKLSDSMYMGDNLSNGYNNKKVYTVNSIDLTNYKTLYFEYDVTYNYCNGNSNEFLCMISDNQSPPSDWDTAPRIGYSGFDSSVERTVAQLDISSISGNKYIVAVTGSANYPNEQIYGHIYSIWLE